MNNDSTINFNSIGKLLEDMRGIIIGELKNMNTLNIIVAGKAGVGKSTLINAVFGEDLTETGQGYPVTKSIRRIMNTERPLVLYDSPGLELKDEQRLQLKIELEELIQKRMAEGVENAIHVIWYCINASNNRIEDEEMEWLKDLTTFTTGMDIPVILVLTRSTNKGKAREFKSKIEAMNLDIRNIVPLLAFDDEDEDDNVVRCHAWGLPTLVSATAQVIPESVKRTLASLQQVNTSEKVKAAKMWANSFIIGSAGVGLSPVPFSDALILAPAQVLMLTGITSTFGFQFDKAYLTTVLSSLLGVAGASFAGRTIVSNLLRFIPGPGTVVGGFISGTTAALLTAALGRAYIKVLTKLVENGFTAEMMKDKKNLDKLASMLKQEWQTELKTGSKKI